MQGLCSPKDLNFSEYFQGYWSILNNNKSNYRNSNHYAIGH